jgi:hypothetical protein
MRRHLVVIFAVSTVVFGGALASACSSSTDEATPSRPVIPPVDASVGIDEGGADSEAAAAVDAASCNGGPQGCFTCEPVQLDDFLNACTDGQCTPFDNVARLPLYKAGQALPPVP